MRICSSSYGLSKAQQRQPKYERLILKNKILMLVLLFLMESSHVKK